MGLSLRKTVEYINVLEVLQRDYHLRNTSAPSECSPLSENHTPFSSYLITFFVKAEKQTSYIFRLKKHIFITITCTHIFEHNSSFQDSFISNYIRRWTVTVLMVSSIIIIIENMSIGTALVKSVDLTFNCQRDAIKTSKCRRDKKLFYESASYVKVKCNELEITLVTLNILYDRSCRFTRLCILIN